MSTTVELTDYERKWTATPSFELPECPAYTPWLPVLERLRSVAAGDGYKVLRLVVVVDGDGRPTHWLEPRVVRVEPKGQAEGALATLLDELAKA